MGNHLAPGGAAAARADTEAEMMLKFAPLCSELYEMAAQEQRGKIHIAGELLRHWGNEAQQVWTERNNWRCIALIFGTAGLLHIAADVLRWWH